MFALWLLMSGVHWQWQVDDAVHELGRHLPSAVKSASAQASHAVHAVPELAREIADGARRSGVKGVAKDVYGMVQPVAKDLYVRCEPVAKDLYARYEPAAEHLAVSAWRSLNGLPVFPQVAHIVVPTAAYWCEKYNRVISFAAGRGFPGARFLPGIPIERIAKAFGTNSAGERSPDAKPTGLDAQTSEERSSDAKPMGLDAQTSSEERSSDAKPMGLDAQTSSEERSPDAKAVGPDAQTGEESSPDAKPVESDAQTAGESQPEAAKPMDLGAQA
ncbi:unnamed protein product [Triticum turgidum subsp. durum]|uniref:Stress-related protein n=1 Tax=Triticum turgidum subsp. durum TaxID=4567 RepID=A0A9R1NKI5_TRITD|nr:unnamed protein product [Triticum turgidum subsp. durum]